MTHGQSRERRRQMATDVKSGMSCGDVANKHGVTMSLVYGACREHGVRVHYDQRKSANKALLIFRMCWLDGLCDAEVAKALDISVGRVSAVKRMAKEAGWPASRM